MVKDAIIHNGQPSARFAASTDLSLLKAMDCIIICVPTPISRNREPDMTYVFNTTRMIARHLARGQLVFLESTTYPGTTDRDVRAILEETGLRAGKDFHLACSPERVDPGNKEFTLRTTPKIVGGYTRRALPARMRSTMPASRQGERRVKARRSRATRQASAIQLCMGLTGGGKTITMKKSESGGNGRRTGLRIQRVTP